MCLRQTGAVQRLRRALEMPFVVAVTAPQINVDAFGVCGVGANAVGKSGRCLAAGALARKGGHFREVLRHGGEQIGERTVAPDALLLWRTDDFVWAGLRRGRCLNNQLLRGRDGNLLELGWRRFGRSFLHAATIPTSAAYGSDR